MTGARIAGMIAATGDRRDDRDDRRDDRRDRRPGPGLLWR